MFCHEKRKGTKMGLCKFKVTNDLREKKRFLKKALVGKKEEILRIRFGVKELCR